MALCCALALIGFRDALNSMRRNNAHRSTLLLSSPPVPDHPVSFDLIYDTKALRGSLTGRNFLSGLKPLEMEIGR
jgi:hypothetical protein